MTAGADLRLLRAAVFTVVCVTLSATGHALASGTPVPPGTLAAGCALVLAVAASLAGRERALPGIAGALLLGQAVLHVLFSRQHPVPTPVPGSEPGGVRALAARLLCGDQGAASLSTAEAHQIVAGAGLATGPGGTSGHGAGHGAGTVSGSPLGVLESAFATLSAPMLLGHLLAAAVTGWLLWRGEAALWRLVRLSAHAALSADSLTLTVVRRVWGLVRALVCGAASAPPPLSATARTAHDVMVRPQDRLLANTVHRRGPPRVADRFALAA